MFQSEGSFYLLQFFVFFETFLRLYLPNLFSAKLVGLKVKVNLIIYWKKGLSFENFCRRDWNCLANTPSFMDAIPLVRNLTICHYHQSHNKLADQPNPLVQFLSPTKTSLPKLPEVSGANGQEIFSTPASSILPSQNHYRR